MQVSNEDTLEDIGQATRASRWHVGAPAGGSSRVAGTGSAGTGTILVLISAVSFGAMPVFATLAYREGESTRTLLALRFLVAGVMLWLILLAQRRTGRAGPSPWRRLPGLVAMGAVGYVGQSFAYFTAVSLIPASTTGLLLYTYPILVTVLAWLLFKERFSARKAVALVLATLGTLLVLGVVSSALSGGVEFAAGLNPTGVFWGLAAGVIYAAYIIAGTRLASGVPPVFSSAVVITSAEVVYLVWGAIAGDLEFSLTAWAWVWTVAIALLCTVIAISLFLAGLEYIGPSRAAIVSTLEPAMTVLLAALVLGDALTVDKVLGGLLVILSVVVLQYRRRSGSTLSKTR